MKQIIHINQHNIKHNRKNPDDRKPVITCKTYKDNLYYNNVNILNKSTGEVLGQIIYSPDKPLSCGANVWIELDTEIVEVEEL